LEDLLLPVRGQAIDLDGSRNDEIEGMCRLALMEQVVALVQVEQLAGAHQLIHLLVVERLEQMVAAEDLVVYAMKHHARHPVSTNWPAAYAFLRRGGRSLSPEM